MEINIKRHATELEKAIQQSIEYDVLRKSYAEITKDASSQKLFNEFRQLQMSLQTKQMTGQQPTEDEITELKTKAALVQQNEKITNLFEAEQKMAVLIDEINKIFMKPIGEVYNYTGADV